MAGLLRFLILRASDSEDFLPVEPDNAADLPTRENPLSDPSVDCAAVNAQPISASRRREQLGCRCELHASHRYRALETPRMRHCAPRALDHSVLQTRRWHSLITTLVCWHFAHRRWHLPTRFLASGETDVAFRSAC